MKLYPTFTFDSVRDYLGRLLMILGIVFLLIGVLLLSAISSLYAYSWLSAAGFFIGLVLIGVGFQFQLGSFSISSLWGRVSSAFVTAGFALFGALLMALTYTRVIGYTYIPITGHSVLIGYQIIPTIDYPLAWIIYPCLIGGIASFVIGVLMKALLGLF